MSAEIDKKQAPQSELRIEKWYLSAKLLAMKRFLEEEYRCHVFIDTEEGSFFK